MNPRGLVVAGILALAIGIGGRQIACAQQAQDPRVADLIQSGKLRVGVGLGTPLAVKNPITGDVGGPTLDLGRALAARIGVDLVAIEYPRLRCRH
jgi:hypothetical protein